MARSCQNKWRGREKWGEKKATKSPAPAKIRVGVGNGRRWDERKDRDVPKWLASASIRGEKRKNGANRRQRRI